MEHKIWTYEEVMALMAENAKGFAELRESQRENAKGFAELRESQEKTDKQMKVTDEKLNKLHESILEFKATVTGISDNSGYHAEQYFQEALAKNKVFGGEKYDKVIKNLSFQGKESCKFDIFMVNGESVAIIEAKNRIHPDFVKKIAEEKVSQFRKYFPEYKNYKLRLGIAGFSFDKSVLQEARKYGVGIIRQVGDAVEFDDKDLKIY